MHIRVAYTFCSQCVSTCTFYTETTWHIFTVFWHNYHPMCNFNNYNKKRLKTLFYSYQRISIYTSKSICTFTKVQTVNAFAAYCDLWLATSSSASAGHGSPLQTHGQRHSVAQRHVREGSAQGYCAHCVLAPPTVTGVFLNSQWRCESCCQCEPVACTHAAACRLTQSVLSAGFRSSTPKPQTSTTGRTCHAASTAYTRSGTPPAGQSDRSCCSKQNKNPH